MNPGYKKMVAKLEKKGATTSDAQGVADLKFDPQFNKKKKSMAKKMKVHHIHKGEKKDEGYGTGNQF